MKALSRRRFLGLSAGAAAALSPLGLLATRAAAAPAYLLPYPGGFVWQCVQGNNSGGSHSGRAAWAWDFRMPQGSPVLAARDGAVAMLKQDSDESCPQNIYACPDWNNYIVIDHGDGTSAAYLHGFHNGARVRLGQQVRQGDVLGISGTTGQSAGPHLHFQVQHTDPRLYIAQSIPSAFTDVADSGVPVRRGVYPSSNARPADFDIRGGHFFSQPNGGGGVGRGFSVTDESGIPMWSTLLGGGGVSAIGYPLSRRFRIDGLNAVFQVFQRQVFVWDLAQSSMRAVNIPELPVAPLDGAAWLASQSALPLAGDINIYDRAWNDWAAGRLAFLEAQPRFKDVYFSAPDPVNHFGLPLEPATETPNGIMLKATRAGFSIAKRDSGFSKSGDLSVSNAGDLYLDAEPLSHRSFEPEPLFPEETIPLLIPAG